jgi:hypothetical protein
VHLPNPRDNESKLKAKSRRMNTEAATSVFVPRLSAGSADVFLRANPASLYEWVVRQRARLIWFCIGFIVVGAGMYGATIGIWREPLQALYTGIKLPLVILLTTVGNGLLNGMLAPLLGLQANFRQSFVLVLISFALASFILAGFSPLALFLVWNTPPLDAMTRLSSPEYGFLQLMLAGFIATAGIIGNVRLLPLLRRWTTSHAIARRVLFAWLATNLFLGSQIAWVLRPFIWDPAGKTRFIGREYFRGSFYETVFEATRRLIIKQEQNL